MKKNNEWVQAVYKEIFEWNSVKENPKIRAVVLYRWPKFDTSKSIELRPWIIEDLKKALFHEYINH